MSWYIVRKKIRGETYLYRQRSWREGGKVKTQCQCLGRADDTSPPLRETKSQKKPSMSTSQTNHNTTTIDLLKKHGIEPKPWHYAALKEGQAHNPFVSKHPSSVIQMKYGVLITGNSYKKPNWQKAIEKQKEEAKRLDTLISKRATLPSSKKQTGLKGRLIDWWRFNTTKLEPFTLESKKISQKSLEGEYASMANALRGIGYTDAEIPTVVIMKGTKLGWHKPVFKKNTYVVTLQETTGRTNFKKAYREALAEIWLDKVKAKDREAYNEINTTAIAKGRGRKDEVRTRVAELIKKGANKTIQKHTWQTKSPAKLSNQAHAEHRLAHIMKAHHFT